MKFISLNAQDSKTLLDILKKEDQLVSEFYGHAKEMELSNKSLVFSRDGNKLLGFRPLGWENCQTVAEQDELLDEKSPMLKSGDFDVNIENGSPVISPSERGKFSHINKKIKQVNFDANDKICELLGLKTSNQFSMPEFEIDNNTVRFQLGIALLDGFVYIAYNELQGEPTKGTKITEEAWEHIVDEVEELA